MKKGMNVFIFNFYSKYSRQYTVKINSLLVLPEQHINFLNENRQECVLA